MADVIIDSESKRINKILNEVTTKIRDDFVQETYRLVDEYYDNYTPARYVRLYEPKRKLRNKKGTTRSKPKGGVSLYEAIHKGGIEDPIIGVSGKYKGFWAGGVIFNSSKFEYRHGMRHPDKGITEWNIFTNFLFAGKGEHGDIRSHIQYDHPSADEELMYFYNTYKPKLDKHYQDAYKKYTR
jgi:hypothetical protein